MVVKNLNKKPESLTVIFRQISLSKKDGITRNLEEIRQKYLS